MTLGKFVIGRVIKAMQANWHPDCFRCEICNEALADSGFVKNAGRYVFLNVLSQGCVLAESVSFCCMVGSGTVVPQISIDGYKGNFLGSIGNFPFWGLGEYVSSKAIAS